MSRILRKAVFLFLIPLGLPLVGCGGGGSSSPSAAQSPPSAIPQSPATTFFGMHQSHVVACGNESADLDFPLFDASAGSFRIWGTCNAQWAGMDLGGGQYDFSHLDGLLAALKTKGLDDVFISLGSTPNWISSNPGDLVCDQADVSGLPPGMCDPPVDLNQDGTGTDQGWRNFMNALVSHVAASSYLATHAHIRYYEIWSEFARSDTLNSKFTCYCPAGQSGCNPQAGQEPCSFRGTFAQMLRMTQDLRCIVEGIPSDPISALNTTCGQDPTMPARGLDPVAKIMEGDSGPGGQGTTAMQNYLYCNSDPPPNSQCTWSPSNPLGSNSTDIISGHPYFDLGKTPEEIMASVAQELAVLSPADAAKPYFSGEGSWGKNDSVSDPGLEAAYVPRWYITQLMLGVARAYWFAWDEIGDGGAGGLWSPVSSDFPPLQCTTADPVGGFYCTGGIAYIWTVNWLSGATVVSSTCPGTCANPQPGVFMLGLSRPGGYQAQIVWDSTPVSSCSNPMCGATPVPALSMSVAQWRDLTGTTHSGAPAAIGASPIIIENMAVPTT